jgi:hypothetical protein
MVNTAPFSYRGVSSSPAWSCLTWIRRPWRCPRLTRTAASSPRCGGWRAWGAVRAEFEHALAEPADPAIVSAEIASELRRNADYVRVTLALTVVTTDVADALAIAWDAFCSAARDDLKGWEVTAAAAEVQPESP